MAAVGALPSFAHLSASFFRAAAALVNSGAVSVSWSTVVRETREECGLAVRVGAWRRTAIEHVFSVTEQAHFEKRNTFCDAAVVGPVGEATEIDHALVWTSAAEATALLTPASHRWAVGEWLASGAPFAAAAPPHLI